LGKQGDNTEDKQPTDKAHILLDFKNQRRGVPRRLTPC
jgi:hypothetical protein